MSRIILIETSSALCSTAIAVDGKTVCRRCSSEPRVHASMTAVYIKEMLDEYGLGAKDCDAVCISAGPGSYTGLRVGSSSAKGLCFGASLKLLSVGTPDVIAAQAIDDGLLPEGCTSVVAMTDARRMEVYCAVFSPDGSRLSPTEAKIIDSDSFSELLEAGPVLFAGDGAEKCKTVLTHSNAHFAAFCPQARAMAGLAQKEYDAANFRDIAYFEPFYLKEFQPTVPKNLLNPEGR
ncbi:MAG: tRNA (adenosine(37)-N6)-threonylcarbamoyltransferase complex dimerization subunit type 1 TsaB [Bacteroidales bacterium]|nr:tRNA (adenosine(37)-N6)-threonylcarbamoyltransferase complex dimerization subunit type 1 TsaB [Bacteroidales bacterium]